jgi:hypothetical protein
MDVLLTWAMLLIAATLVSGSTIAIVIALRKGDDLGKTLKTWLTRLFDAICGIG